MGETNHAEQTVFKTHPQELKCKFCHHEWTEYITLPMEINAFVVRLEAMGKCPKCGKKGALLGKGPFWVDDKKEVPNGKTIIPIQETAESRCGQGNQPDPGRR